MTRPSAFVTLAVVAMGLCASGCVQRRMMIRSNPPGAMVYVDDYEIGVTPVAHNFLYYGDRKIRLVKDGYQTLTVIQSIPPPWYQIPPLDFFSENLVPAEIRDQRTYAYQLTPQMVVPTEQLLGRAEQLRQTSGTPRGSATLPAPLPAAPARPTPAPPMQRPEVIPAPEGFGGQRIHPLPPTN